VDLSLSKSPTPTDVCCSQEIISEGPISIVTRIQAESPAGTQFIAIKTSTTVHAKEPHDIIKEARLLALASHPNVCCLTVFHVHSLTGSQIIPLIKRELSRSHSLSLWMPYIPYSLDDLLQSSKFSPHPLISFGSTASSTVPTARELQFVVLAKSIIFQVLCGVSYLHSDNVQIAHRDIKPSNVLLTASGCVQLIDFGIAIRTVDEHPAQDGDLWPESPHRMYFEVSTGYVWMDSAAVHTADDPLHSVTPAVPIVHQNCSLGHERTTPSQSTLGASV
jgi:serine/threonine protein kinase